jgi:hypothetical protein
VVAVSKRYLSHKTASTLYAESSQSSTNVTRNVSRAKFT